MTLKTSLILYFSFFFLLNNFYTNAQEELEVTEVSENLYAIINPQGGNIAFLVTRKGVLVVDAGSSPINGEKIISAIRTVTIKPLTHLILTHMHGDHIYGISGFPDDIKIISHVNLEKNNAELNHKDLTNYKENIFPAYLANLKLQLDSVSDKESEEYAILMESYNANVDYFENIKNIKFRKPDITFEDYYLLKMADQRIVLEYTGPGHTNDNIVVKFSNHNVIHTGDLVFNGSFPYLIVEHGVDVYNWIRTLDDLYKENIYTVIPGHGEIGRKVALKDQSDYFRKLSHQVEAFKNAGYDLEEIKERIDINDYDLKGNEDQFPINIEVIYTELVNKGRGWWEF